MSYIFPGPFPADDAMQVIRSDSIITPQLQAAQMQLAPAFSMHSRAEGAKLMKARWEAERQRLSSSKE